jgi:hypothetical protein
MSSSLYRDNGQKIVQVPIKEMVTRNAEDSIMEIQRKKEEFEIQQECKTMLKVENEKIQLEQGKTKMVNQSCCVVS